MWPRENQNRIKEAEFFLRTQDPHKEMVNSIKIVLNTINSSKQTVNCFIINILFSLFFFNQLRV